MAAFGVKSVVWIVWDRGGVVFEKIVCVFLGFKLEERRGCVAGL